jgi:arginine N-succinyltransferase
MAKTANIYLPVRIRMARPSDVEDIFALAQESNGRLSTLPADRDILALRIDDNIASLGERQSDSSPEFLLVAEDTESGAIVGTGNIKSAIGAGAPVDIFRLSTVTVRSDQLRHRATSEILLPVNELDGCARVGGLFLTKSYRGGHAGRLLARSRYGFIASHRGLFPERIVSELRGDWTDDGQSAFWDVVCRPFFGISLLEAEHHASKHGSRFISELMPRHPIYAALLPDAARAVIGKAHREGQPAKALLEAEGFAFEGHVHVFDAGPILVARIDALRTVREARPATVRHMNDDVSNLAPQLLQAHTGEAFRAAIAPIALSVDGDATLSGATAALLDIQEGDQLTYAPV